MAELRHYRIPMARVTASDAAAQRLAPQNFQVESTLDEPQEAKERDRRRSETEDKPAVSPRRARYKPRAGRHSRSRASKLDTEIEPEQGQHAPVGRRAHSRSPGHESGNVSPGGQTRGMAPCVRGVSQCLMFAHLLCAALRQL